jgi:hypothetical protein
MVQGSFSIRKSNDPKLVQAMELMDPVGHNSLPQIGQAPSFQRRGEFGTSVQ